jgi:hypothetical protein
MKIPEPIIDPATIIVASSKPSERLKLLSSRIASSAVRISSAIGLNLVQDKKKDQLDISK